MNDSDRGRRWTCLRVGKEDNINEIYGMKHYPEMLDLRIERVNKKRRARDEEADLVIA